VAKKRSAAEQLRRTGPVAKRLAANRPRRNVIDPLDHEILVRKLGTLGCSSTFVNFLYSYLTGRKQFVSLHEHRSNFFDCPSGVPQGSVFAPLLFIFLLMT
jgi:hypothetical protein